MSGSHPPDALDLPASLPVRMLRLRLADAEQLRQARQLLLKATDDRSGLADSNGLALYVEELCPPVKVTLADVRIQASDLRKAFPAGDEPLGVDALRKLVEPKSLAPFFSHFEVRADGLWLRPFEERPCRAPDTLDDEECRVLEWTPGGEHRPTWTPETTKPSG